MEVVVEVNFVNSAIKVYGESTKEHVVYCEVLRNLIVLPNVYGKLITIGREKILHNVIRKI